ncbi:MAG: A24 family peptidase [Thiotrichaceae bacterium]|nr:A24 family peptidase [Thiotrichaceae bacterium]
MSHFLSDSTTLVIVIGIFGLLIGSFLNVVIYRYPIMMKRDWQADFAEYTLEKFPPAEPICINYLQGLLAAKKAEVFNLVTPRSRCPHCGHLISALENIPVISYLWQRARCRACQQPISIRYPLVEIGSALLAGFVALHFGYGAALLAALIFTWLLLAMSLIDVDHQLLPDEMTLLLLWLGIFCNYFGLFTSLQLSVLGAIFGYLSLWTVALLFKWLFGKEGMGHGDFKLLAALGAWMGWEALPMIILLSSLVGAILGTAMLLVQGRDKNTPIPYGPYLACAGWANLLWSNQIMRAYQEIIGWLSTYLTMS